MDLWVKSAHIVSVISWMAAMLYLPRLMVYHVDADSGSDLSDTLKVMERRLLKAIMTPAMIGTWIFGIWLATLYDVWADVWFIFKFLLVLSLTAMHGFCAKWVKDFAADTNERPAKFFRVVNEVPAMIMIIIVVLVVVKPF